MLGKVTEVGDTFVTLEIADGVRVKVQKLPDHAADAQGHAEKRLRPCSNTPAGNTSSSRRCCCSALLFALPNVFGEDPALQVARKDHAAITTDAAQAVEIVPQDSTACVSSKSYIDKGRLMVRFANVPDQLAARDAVERNDDFKNTYITALSFAPRTPERCARWACGPCRSGLDLRGGLYLLYQVDVNSARSPRRSRATRRTPVGRSPPPTSVQGRHDGRRPAARPERGPHPARSRGRRERGTRGAQPAAAGARDHHRQRLPSGPAVEAAMTPAQIRERQDYAIQQNITTLRNRVNELGVSEPIVQRQGVDRINVQLPGVQNSAEVKDILGRVATLEFRLEDMQNNAVEAAQLGRAPLGSKLYTHTRIGRPMLLKREIIATGDQLTNATTGQSQEGPGGQHQARRARRGEHAARPRAPTSTSAWRWCSSRSVRETTEVDGKKVSREVTDEEVINDATIRGVFSNNFQITGLAAGEARDLALLLRSGSLATAIYAVEERAVGPSLGEKNIEQGRDALIIGMAGVFVFMAIYYQVFGLVADLVLLANVVLLTALLSMMRAGRCRCPASPASSSRSAWRSMPTC